jgi:excisionase family DNA binding protein
MATPDSRPRNRTDPTRPAPERPRRRDDDQAPKLLTPRDVAKALKCSEWWVKEQARKGRIPFSWIGGSYRFTHEHLHEIIRVFERRPVAAASEAVTAQRRSPRTRTGSRAAGAVRAPQANRLTARPPRRTRQTTPPDAQA